MKIKKIIKLYQFICKKYFYFSFLIILSIPIITYYTNLNINTIFMFTFDNLNKNQLIFYITSNFILSLIYHKIINKLYNIEYLNLITILWIIPLIFQIFRIIKILAIFYYPTFLILIMKL